MHDIKIGTMSSLSAEAVPKLAGLGFESLAVGVWPEKDKGFNEKETADAFRKLKDKADECGIEISCVSLFANVIPTAGGNPDLINMIGGILDNAHLLGTDLFTGFTGRIPELSVEDNIPEFKKVWGGLLEKAEGNGLRIAFENCPMGGDWRSGGTNIAFCPRAWEMMFNALDSDNIGLQWEPCHQMVQLIDPVPQLRKWVGKVFHVHGKDATIAWDIVKEQGIEGPDQWAWHRTPGFGDSNWSDIITILRQNGYKGNIDIEGWHDPVYRGELEYTGQVHGMKYLKNCRGGDYVINPF